MAFGLFNFHVDNERVAEMISISDLMLLAVAPSVSPAIEGNPSTTIPLAPLEEEPRLKLQPHQLGQTTSKIHLHPQPPPIASIAMLTTMWAPKIFCPMRSSAVKILGEVLQLSTQRYPSANGLSTPSRSVLCPTTLIMLKGYTRTIHDQMMTMTSTPKLSGRLAIRLAHIRANLPHQATDTWSIMTLTS
jgi:hypothetical protein